MNKCAVLFCVVMLVMQAGCADAVRLSSQLAERVGLRERGGNATVPVIYPSEMAPRSARGGNIDDASDWEYGASGDLRSEAGAVGCAK